MRTCAAKVQLPSECRISHSSQSTYFDAVALPVQGGTDTSWRRMCRFRPPFVGVMRWRKKLPPNLAISCRFAAHLQPDARPSLVHRIEVKPGGIKANADRSTS